MAPYYKNRTQENSFDDWIVTRRFDICSSTGRLSPQDKEHLYSHEKLSAGINFKSYSDIPIEVEGAPTPSINTFHEIQLHHSLMANIENCGFESLTPVQKMALPLGIEGYDLLTCAQTGSGKTAAFLVPLINKILSAKFSSSREGREVNIERRKKIHNFTHKPLVLVLCPTRELAKQVFLQAVRLCHKTGVLPAVVYGGASRGFQLQNLRRCNGVDILVGTPGRVNDFIKAGDITLKEAFALVLDEADRMLDMGFYDQIIEAVENGEFPSLGGANRDNGAKVSSKKWSEFKSPWVRSSSGEVELTEGRGQTREREDKGRRRDKEERKEEGELGRQVLMFSATFPKPIQNLAREFLSPKNAFIKVGVIGASNSDVKQEFKFVKGGQSQKFELLVHLIKFGSFEGFEDSNSQSTEISGENERTEKKGKEDLKILIFVNTKRDADQIEQELRSRRVCRVTAIHGDKSQDNRDRSLRAFRSGKNNVMVATDVAARGLDIPDVNLVVNYDLAKEAENHVHRIGRTGRCGNRGHAVTFITENENKNLWELVQNLKKEKIEVPKFMESLARESKFRKSFSGSGRRGSWGRGGGYRRGGREGGGGGFGGEKRSYGGFRRGGDYGGRSSY